MKLKLTVLAIVCLVAKAMAEEDVQQLEDKLTKAMDDLNDKSRIEIYGDMISIEQVPVEGGMTDNVQEANADPLISRVERFFRTRKLHVQLPSDGSSADLLGRALGEKELDIPLRGLVGGASEARGKLKRYILPILLALKFKTMIELPIFITVVGLIGVKALSLAFIGVILSGAVALRALLAPPPPPTARISYAGYIKPHDVHHEHWHRSQDDISNNQPYRGWAPEYNGDGGYPYHDLS